VRCDNNSKLQDSAPCQNCLNTILELNIKRIVFSYKDNTFVSCNPKELTINHISAGNNFIKRLQTNNTPTNLNNTNLNNTTKNNTNLNNTNLNNTTKNKTNLNKTTKNKTNPNNTNPNNTTKNKTTKNKITKNKTN
jgi:deoxycytidylate deaminase